MREDPLKTPHLRGGPQCPRRTLHPRPFGRLNQHLSCQTLLPLEILLLPLTGLLSQHRGFHFFLSITVHNTKQVKPDLCIRSFWIPMSQYIYSIKDGSSSSGSNDSDSSEGRGKRRKNFEVLPRSCQSRSACPTFLQAFVMTGDRMINLAKTPANADWKSK